MSDAIRYIGIAKKAGAIEAGENNSGAAIRAGKAKVLLLASDASDNARRRAEGFIYGRSTPLVKLPYTKESLAAIMGTGDCAMVAVTDIGLASSFMNALAAEDETFADIASEIAFKKEKALRRKREASAHERNIRRGKKQKSVEASGKRRNKK